MSPPALLKAVGADSITGVDYRILQCSIIDSPEQGWGNTFSMGPTKGAENIVEVQTTRLNTIPHNVIDIVVYVSKQQFQSKNTALMHET